ncbi:hypothetical protein SVEN_1532 [Streptomyces venezuelae ATCC 10712]|uniref:Uncharacterized protein n=1 Tax=Streptomyces venezuelae (strain ATCC 10712 / CBS 650.69 / DSM 40230 / JCM 4526 / NBRC 13096 / PD 04745) TaxID=953739 RepID=F2RGK8_STRVP|nr:hypothetical protein SVEN_1532 [Streptomyces venezuelae ATCC 10712]
MGRISRPPVLPCANPPRIPDRCRVPRLAMIFVPPYGEQVRLPARTVTRAPAGSPVSVRPGPVYLCRADHRLRPVRRCSSAAAR